MNPISRVAGSRTPSRIARSRLSGRALEDMCTLTVELVEHIQQEIGIIGFWSKPQARESLRSWLFTTLDNANVLPFKRLDAVADKLMELAKANHRRLVQT